MSVVSAVLKRPGRGVVFIIPCYKYILLLSSTVQKPVLTKLDLVINSGKKQMCFAFIHDLFSTFFLWPYPTGNKPVKLSPSFLYSCTIERLISGRMKIKNHTPMETPN